MKDFHNKVALVTGAARGMGKDLSKRLLREGCRVAVIDIDAKELAKTHRQLSSIGECRPYTCDISDRRAVYRMARAVRREIGPVSILINNAGIVKARELIDLEDAVIQKTIDVNLTSQFWLCKAFLPDMIKANEGHIVNYASAGGILAIPNLSAYCASKFGVIGLSDSLRQEMKKNRYNIGITYVCPNTVDTGMFRGSKMVAGTTMLTAGQVNSKVIKAIRKNRALVAVPGFSVKVLTPLTKVLLPVKAMDRLNAFLGMDTANDSWTGR